jgi:hypothetical protein
MLDTRAPAGTQYLPCAGGAGEESWQGWRLTQIIHIPVMRFQAVSFLPGRCTAVPRHYSTAVPRHYSPAIPRAYCRKSILIRVNLDQTY